MIMTSTPTSTLIAAGFVISYAIVLAISFIPIATSTSARSAQAGFDFSASSRSLAPAPEAPFAIADSGQKLDPEALQQPFRLGDPGPAPAVPPDLSATAAAPRSHVCNADSLLSSAAADRLDEIAGALERDRGFQIGYAVAESINPPGGEKATAEEAKRAAKRLHDRWGVGHRGQGDGVVVLLSAQDRRAYISTGVAPLPLPL
eukprot:tig00021221_g19349.t1